MAGLTVSAVPVISVGESASIAQMLVLCSTCGDAVELDAPCLTCGVSDPQAPRSDQIDEEALLARTADALDAQSELAHKTAAERSARALELCEQTLVLRGRMRRQASLMRSLMSERRRLQSAEFTAAIGRIDSALESSSQYVGTDRRGLDVLVPRDRTCSAVARRVLEDHLNGSFEREVVENAMLVVSELVTNALLHGRGKIELRTELRSGRLRIEVVDDGRPDRICMCEQKADQVHGRGLWLVDQLSDAWGAQTSPARVWAELPVH